MTITAPLSSLAVDLIGLYQRRISPVKGFSCAFRVSWGRQSCSQFARRAIDRFGILAGMRLARRRFKRCYLVARMLDYASRPPVTPRPESRQWASGCFRRDLSAKGVAGDCVTFAAKECAYSYCGGPMCWGWAFR